jgi:hypothetical protein
VEVTGPSASEDNPAVGNVADPTQTAEVSETTDDEAAVPTVPDAPELTPDEQTRMDEYHALRDRINDLDQQIEANDALLEAADGVGSREAVAPGFLTMQRLEASGEIKPLHDDYQFAMGEVESSFAAVEEQMATNEALLTTQGALLQGDELEGLQTYAGDALKESAGPLEEATDGLLQHIDDPVFQEFFKDWEPERQQEFLRDMTHYMPHTDAGRAWIAEFSDALAQPDQSGQTGAFADVFRDLRGELGETELQALDHDLGSLVGLDLLGRPEGSQERLTSVGESLGLPPEQIALMLNASPSDNPEALGTFAHSVGLTLEAHNRVVDTYGGGNASISQVSGMAGAVEASGTGLKGLADLASRSLRSSDTLRLLNAGLETMSRLGSGIAHQAGVVGDVFDAISVVQQVSRGDIVGAGSTASGIVGGAMLASSSAPVAIAGGVLIGAGLAVPAFLDHQDYIQFRNQGIETVLGAPPGQTMRGLSLQDASPLDIQRLEAMRPSNISLPQFFEFKMSSQQQTSLMFWEQIEAEYGRAQRDGSLLGPPQPLSL